MNITGAQVKENICDWVGINNAMPLGPIAFIVIIIPSISQMTAVHSVDVVEEDGNCSEEKLSVLCEGAKEISEAN